MATGKHGGARRGARVRTWSPRTVFLLAFGIVFCFVAWGVLVFAAIDFGTSARGGDSRAWGFLVVASLGAVACLFAGLILAARVLRHIGALRSPDAVPTDEATRPVGGRRAAR